MTQTKDKPKVKTYNDFVSAIQNLGPTYSDKLLSFYKYCYQFDELLDLNAVKELIEEELIDNGLKPFKITDDLDVILRFKKKAECVIQIKAYGIDYFIHRL